MRILVTGAAGFLGWHTRARLHALTEHEVVTVTRSTWARLPELMDGADAVIHCAGINRGDDSALSDGNAGLARDVVEAARAAGVAPRFVYANSIQSGNGTPYGDGKAAAAATLEAGADELGSKYVDVRLPNIFGEYGRPQYNSFVATFAHAVAHGSTPSVQDRPVGLLHVQQAAEALIGGLTAEPSTIEPGVVQTSVQEVYDRLQSFRTHYRGGDIPPLTTDFEVDLFNTYRGALFPSAYPVGLTRHTDDRGWLVETVRAHGGQGQTFVSTTKPGITRGEHFHLGKVERFVVLEGQARISLRKVLTDEVVSFDVSGETPVAIDMPTLWVHNITNTGLSELITLFWTHTLFDPQDPDTFWEPVDREAQIRA